ncbi:hypothetical protein [Sporomusa malonica]|uniref:HEAT repeat-containing protein n=1 Tax=Sporomusa malonica TaxID=112901 RepID=A0A1W2D611_9FIRM|nr:hypothetical protein [Sporomusa malonica]SMC92488.1 hypothetical protein SAMN04488500_113121 [Sporomusa malonica]
MLNYEHETKEIANRYLKYFIFSDYFHDSIILKVAISDNGNQLTIELSCEREWPTHDRKYMNDPQYLYKLIFEDCKHVEYQRRNTGNVAEYINGRLKKSAKLHYIITETRKIHYHLRIQLADGFLDLVFRKFTIEKAEGLIELPNRISLRWYFDWVIKKYDDCAIDEVRNIAMSNDSIFKTVALEYLWLMNDDICSDIATRHLSDEDAWIAAVFILGEVGSVEVVPRLINLISIREYDSLAYRHIHDAIEKIIFRKSLTAKR